MNLLINSLELNQLLNSDKPPLLFDCRFSLMDHQWGRQQHQQGHIPGAQYLDMETQLSGAKGAHGGRHPLPSADDFTQLMQRSGVNKDSLVIAYDDNRLAGAARLWWLLQYFGHKNIRVLNGGIKSWLAGGYALTQETASPPPGNFEAQPQATQIRDYTWVSSHLNDPQVQIIDSREPARYQGLEEPIDPVAGHIPGALNYPWVEVSNDQGIAYPDSQQRERWQALDRTKETLVYCGSGITASVNLLALKLAGIEQAKLYPGSWSDWCSYPESPKIP